jgi:hypothetical protein
MPEGSKQAVEEDLSLTPLVAGQVIASVVDELA